MPIDAIRDFGLPRPKIKELAGGIDIEIFGESSEKTREKTRNRLLDLIKGSSSITTEELANKLGISAKGVEWQLNKLKQEGIIKRVGPDKGGHWEIKRL